MSYIKAMSLLYFNEDYFSYLTNSCYSDIQNAMEFNKKLFNRKCIILCIEFKYTQQMFSCRLGFVFVKFDIACMKINNVIVYQKRL